LHLEPFSGADAHFKTSKTMPIYAYKCESCGHTKDVLQKMSDAPLSDCPQCGAPAFKKQVTAAGFQLKGSGWYVTDFRGGSSAAAAPSANEAAATIASPADSSPAAPKADTAAAPAPVATPAPAASGKGAE
jgi:putative FmdB family regulatory protein